MNAKKAEVRGSLLCPSLASIVGFDVFFLHISGKREPLNTYRLRLDFWVNLGRSGGRHLDGALLSVFNPKMEGIDVWRSAHHMMKRYGDDAASRAAERADELLAAGDGEGFQVWQRIAAAIDELERDKPSTAEPIN